MKKPTFTVKQAEYLRYTIGNNIFAMETSLCSLRDRVTDTKQLAMVESLSSSLESMKSFLKELDSP
jgi:hypothetical protein